MLKEKQYQNEDFSGHAFFVAEITRKEFVDCNFTGADFSDIEMMYGCRFVNCNLAGAKMNGVHFRSCAFLNCRFRDNRFFAAVMEDCKMTGSAFFNIDFSDLTIEGGDWSLCGLRFAEFRKKKLKGVRFAWADLAESKFIGCRVEDCDFAQAVMHNVSFYQSDIRGSDFSATDLTALDLRGAKVDLEQCLRIAEAAGAKYVP